MSLRKTRSKPGWALLPALLLATVVPQPQIAAQEETSEGAAPQAVSQPGATRVAVIDVRRILLESTAGKAAIEELRQLAESRQSALAAKEEEAAELQETIETQRLTLAEGKLEEMERDLQDMVIDMRRDQDDARRELEERQVAEFGKIEEKVMPLIQELGEEMGYTLIFNKFEDSGLLFAADGADVTDEVLRRFNALPEG